jgi:hypothetical protein
MKKHLAIFSQSAVKEIFAGKKIVETRFSQKRIAPFAQVSAGDLVYIKPSGEDIAGQFLVSKVIFFDNLDELDWQFIKSHYQKYLSLGSKELDFAYFQQKVEAKFGTIIFINRVEQFIVSPIKIEKKDKRGWVVLEK